MKKSVDKSLWIWYYKDIIKEGLLDRKIGLRATVRPPPPTKEFCECVHSRVKAGNAASRFTPCELKAMASECDMGTPLRIIFLVKGGWQEGRSSPLFYGADQQGSE